jgi:hypothetical protein
VVGRRRSNFDCSPASVRLFIIEPLGDSTWRFSVLSYFLALRIYPLTSILFLNDTLDIYTHSIIDDGIGKYYKLLSLA